MLTVRPGPAHEDGAWIALCGPDNPAALQAVVRAVDAHLDVEIAGTAWEWTATMIRREQAAKEFDEVAVTRMSTGATFAFGSRRALPLIPAEGPP